MKPVLFVIIVYLMLISSANAVDGTLTFNGKLTDSTCKISNSGGPSFSVNLPTVSVTTLNVAGNVAGRTPFKISLTNCTVTNVTTYFETGANVDTVSGRLNNLSSTGAAQNVQIQILNSKGLFIPVLAGGSDGSQPNAEWANITVANGSADLNYAAEYYAAAVTTSGSVNTSVQYTLIYK